MRNEANDSSPVVTPEGLMTMMGAIWLALFPFWQGGSYSHITLDKWRGMLALTGVTVVCAAVAVVLRLLRGERLRPGWQQVAGLAYFALVALSAVFGSWADHAGADGRLTVLWGAYRHEGLITQLCYGAVFLAMSAARVKIRPLLHAASLGLVAYTAVVALQYAGINVLGLFPPGTSMMTNYEFQGTIGNIDMVVGYVALVMGAALGAFACLEKPHPLWLVAGLAGAALTLFMEVQCGLIMLLALLFMLLMMALLKPDSRWRALAVLSGVMALVSLRLMVALPWLDGTQTIAFRLDWRRWIPLVVAGALMVCAAVCRRHPGEEMKPHEAACIGGGLIFLAVVAVYTLPIPAGNGLWELQEMLHGRAQDSFGSERIGVWRLTLEMCRGNLLWGTGPDAFLHAMDHHLWTTGQTLVQRFDNPHNMLLAVLSGSGLPALGAFVLLTAGTAGHALWRAGRNKECLPLALAAVCYLLQGMFTFSICLVTPMFWAALGMLAGQTNERNE